MSGESANKQTVRAYMDAYARWDHVAILACLTDDVEWIVPGAFRLSGKRAFDGEIENPYAAGPPHITVSRLTEEAGVVVAEGSVRNEMKDGSIISLLFCDVFEMQEEAHIRRLTAYLVPVQE